MPEQTLYCVIKPKPHRPAPHRESKFTQSKKGNTFYRSPSQHNLDKFVYYSD